MQVTLLLRVFICCLTAIAIPSVAQDISTFTYGGSKDESGLDLVALADGTILLLTSDRTITAGSEDICLLKIDAGKNIADRKCFGADKQDHPYALIQTNDGGVAISGTRWKSRRDAYLHKLDANLNTEWETFYDGGAHHHDEGFVAIQTQDGGFLLSGMTKSSMGVTRGSMLLQKMSANGMQEWVVHEEVTSKNYLYSVIEDRAGDFVSAGVESGHHQYSEFEFYRPSATGVVIKHDNQGREIWRQSIGGLQNDWITDIAEAPSGGYYLLGSTQSQGAGSFDFYLVKINQDGFVEWEKTYGDIQFDYGRKMEVLENGDLILLGTTCLDPENFSTDILLMRTDSEGNVLWEETYGGSGSEVAHGMSINNNLIYVTGAVTMVEGSDKDIVLLELPLDVTVDVQDRSEPAGQVFVYPNPTDHNVTFELAGVNCKELQLSIHDQLGQLVYSDIHKRSSQIDLDLTAWTSGTYFYRLVSGCKTTYVGKLAIN